MAGAISNGSLGLYYVSQKQKPHIFRYLDRYQVLVPEGKMMRIVAECLYKKDAKTLLKTYLKEE